MRLSPEGLTLPIDIARKELVLKIRQAELILCGDTWKRRT